MARQVNSKIEGVFDGIHYYRWKDKYCKRVMPVKERMSKRTLEESQVFGSANRLSSAIRKEIKPLYTSDRLFMYRMNNACAAILRSLKTINKVSVDALSGFECNSDSSFEDLMPINIIVEQNNGINIIFPTCKLSDLAAPRDTKIIIWNIMLCSCDIENLQTRSYSTRLVIEYNDKEHEEKIIPLPLDIPSGELVTVLIACNYSTTSDKTGIVKDNTWKPAKIISSFIK